MNHLEQLLCSVIADGNTKTFQGLTICRVDSESNKTANTIANFLSRSLDYKLPASFILAHKAVHYQQHEVDQNQIYGNDTSLDQLLRSDMLISLGFAKLFINGLVLTLKKVKAISDPIVVLCDGQSNGTGTYFYVIKPHQNEACRFIVEEVLCNKRPQRAKTKLIQNFSTSLKLRTIPTTLHSCPSLVTKSTSRSTFLIVDYSNHDTTTAVMNDSSVFSHDSSKFISIDVECSKTEQLFSVMDDAVIESSVSICPFPGEKSAVSKLHEELRILQGLLGAFDVDCGKEIEWVAARQDLVEDIENIAPNSIVNDLSSVFAALKTGKDSAQELTNVVSTLMAEKIPVRKHLDFTESIWSVVKNARGLDELRSCYGIIMKELQGDTRRYWLQTDNFTTLANMLRQAYKGKVKVPRASDIFSLRLLVEIGIHKLRRDYMTYLLSKQLAPATLFDDVFQVKDDDDDDAYDRDEKLLRQFEALRKLHHACELTAICLMELELTSENIHSMVRSIFESKSKADYHRVFTTKMNYMHLKKLDLLLPSKLVKYTVTTTATDSNSRVYKNVSSWSTTDPITKLLDDYVSDEMIEFAPSLRGGKNTETFDDLLDNKFYEMLVYTRFIPGFC